MNVIAYLRIERPGLIVVLSREAGTQNQNLRISGGKFVKQWFWRPTYLESREFCIFAT